MRTLMSKGFFRRIPTAGAVAISFLVCPAAILAQTNATISGTVTDSSGGGIPSVSVTITNTAQGLKTKVTADEHGDYIFPSVPVGTYDVLFEAKGFRGEKRTNLVVDANAAVKQNLTLQV